MTRRTASLAKLTEGGPFLHVVADWLLLGTGLGLSGFQCEEAEFLITIVRGNHTVGGSPRLRPTSCANVPSQCIPPVTESVAKL